MDIKYPNVKVKLVGEDGNAMSIIGRCRTAMRRAGLSRELQTEFSDEATSGDYNNVLATCMKWFDCDGEDEDDELAGYDEYEGEDDEDYNEYENYTHG